MGLAFHRTTTAAALGIALALAAGTARADDVLITHRLSAALANTAVGAAVAACAKQGYPVTAVVLDIDGVRQAMLRGDGAGIHTMDSANDKAYTAVTYKIDTITLVEQSKNAPPSPLQAKIPHLVLAQGGIVVTIGQEVIGSIGVGGAPGHDYDTGCARAGLDAIRDRLK